MVIYTMHKRKHQSDFQSKRVINKATTELDLTAIIVTIMFIIVLAYNGVIAYVLNSPVQVKILLYCSLPSYLMVVKCIPAKI